MRVFIAGIDGYLGWPLAQYLAVPDATRSPEMGSQSATAIRPE